MNSEIIIVASVAANGVIGKDNTIPWHLPEDLKRFKTLTSGHTVVMGRKTYESIGEPLPNRLNVVISRDPLYRPHPDVAVFNSIHRAVSFLINTFNSEKIIIIGGSKIYEYFVECNATKMILTELNDSFEGDVMFPKFDKNEWILTDVEVKDTHKYCTYVKSLSAAIG